AASSRPVARVQARMSSSDGVCRPFSIFEIFDCVQPSMSASAYPDRPASLRNSRSCSPRASRVCWRLRMPRALPIRRVGNRVVPGDVAPVAAASDRLRVFDDLDTEQLVLVGETQYRDLA